MADDTKQQQNPQPQNPQENSPREKVENPAAEELHSSTTAQDAAAQLKEATLKIKKMSDDVGQSQSLFGFQASPHSVPFYKKTSDGNTEFTGPLTTKAFKETDFYKAAIEEQITKSIPNMTPERRKLIDLDDTFARQLNQKLGIDDSLNQRIVIQSELGADGKMSPAKIIVGDLNDKNEIHVTSTFQHSGIRSLEFT